jgi:DNA polymerase II small subunit/DNA polymerase delta subunit B
MSLHYYHDKAKELEKLQNQKSDKEAVDDQSGKVKLIQDAQNKLKKLKNKAIQRLREYLYNEFLDSLDEATERDKHSAIVFQLKMIDRRDHGGDGGSVLGTLVEAYKE